MSVLSKPSFSNSVKNSICLIVYITVAFATAPVSFSKPHSSPNTVKTATTIALNIHKPVLPRFVPLPNYTLIKQKRDPNSRNATKNNGNIPKMARLDIGSYFCLGCTLLENLLPSTRQRQTSTSSPTPRDLKEERPWPEHRPQEAHSVVRAV